ncbi:unnamed protein product, partial [Iphiclides podalirius]
MEMAEAHHQKLQHPEVIQEGLYQKTALQKVEKTVSVLWLQKPERRVAVLMLQPIPLALSLKKIMIGEGTQGTRMHPGPVIVPLVENHYPKEINQLNLKLPQLPWFSPRPSSRQYIDPTRNNASKKTEDMTQTHTFVSAFLLTHTAAPRVGPQGQGKKGGNKISPSQPFFLVKC